MNKLLILLLLLLPTVCVADITTQVVSTGNDSMMQIKRTSTGQTEIHDPDASVFTCAAQDNIETSIGTITASNTEFSNSSQNQVYFEGNSNHPDDTVTGSSSSSSTHRVTNGGAAQVVMSIQIQMDGELEFNAWAVGTIKVGNALVDYALANGTLFIHLYIDNQLAGVAELSGNYVVWQNKTYWNANVDHTFLALANDQIVIESNTDTVQTPGNGLGGYKMLMSASGNLQ